MDSIVMVTVDASERKGVLLAPIGMNSPHETCVEFAVQGAELELVTELHTGQSLARMMPEGDEITLLYQFEPTGKHYPEEMFSVRENRYTRAAEALVTEAKKLASSMAGRDRLTAIARDVADRFVYGHPEKRFYEGMDEIPALGCGLTEGSCVDINAYFIAVVRSAGFEAGYVTGYFFPEEKGGRCDDMHCWVVTRHEGEVLEWDIAHHLKMGRRDIEPGLNPKPGCRHALAHSMGLSVPALGISEMKLISEPVWISQSGEPLPINKTILRMDA